VLSFTVSGRHAFAISDVVEALKSAASPDANHNLVSGTILHLIPDPTDLRKYTFQWASTEIMMYA